MANASFFPLKSVLADSVILAGSFSIAASGGAATKISGLRYSVAKSATGEYTITLKDTWNQLVTSYFTIEAGTPVDLVAQLDNHSVSSLPSTVVVNLNSGSTPTEPSAVTVVHFVLVLSNTRVSQ